MAPPPRRIVWCASSLYLSTSASVSSSCACRLKTCDADEEREVTGDGGGGKVCRRLVSRCLKGVHP